MKFTRLLTLLVLSLTIFRVLPLAGQLDDQLVDRLVGVSPDEKIAVWIETATNHRSGTLKAEVVASAATRAERHAIAYTALKSRGSEQAGVLSAINDLKAQGRADRIKGHWIVNIVEAKIAAGDLGQLARRSDIVVIYPAPQTVALDTEFDNSVVVAPDDINGVTSNLQHVRADEAWAMGYNGAGRLICSFDTGVNGNHPDLYSRWKGHDGDSAAAWFDPLFGEKFPHSVSTSGSPFHGTHTLGIAVGANPLPGGDTVGMAPGAKWIAAAVIDIEGASVIDAFEWAADPDGNPNTVADVPDVISHSWGFKNMQCLDVFYTVIENTEVLGIVNVFSAGNEGSASGSIRNPADRALDSLDCFAVGNLNHVTNVIASNSSRGPACDGISIKPNVVAPGTTITSCYYNYTSQLYSTASGTSQSAPHVAGLVALMRQKNPNATVDQIKSIILQSARFDATWGTEPNHNYGWGEIDCVDALNFLPGPNTETAPHLRLYDLDHAPVLAGDTVIGTVVLQNLGAGDNNVFGTVLGTNDALTIIDGILDFGTINQGDTVRSTNQLRVAIADTVTAGTILSTDFYLEGDNESRTVRLHFMVGNPPNKSSATHIGSRISFTLTDYGVLGLGPGSLYPLNGAGYTLDGGANDLWEAGVMVGTGFSRVSSGVHSYLYDPDMDFRVSPSGNIELTNPGRIADQQTWARFDDSGADNPIGLLITQESFLYGPPNDDILVLRYILKNISGGSLSELYFGLFMDFDLPTTLYTSNSGGYESNGDYVWMAHNLDSTNYERFRGVKLLDGPPAARAVISYDDFLHWPPDGSSADGLSTDEKYLALTSGSIYSEVNKTRKDDMFIVVSAGALTMADQQLDTVTFAVLAGDTFADMLDAAGRAELVPTPVEENDPGPLLPTEFTLYQNYPNPFNPSTAISFDMPRRGLYKFEIINVLGQTLLEQSETAGPGRVTVTWNGDGYASGAYFYRLRVGDRSETRKMMLLK